VPVAAVAHDEILPEHDLDAVFATQLTEMALRLAASLGTSKQECVMTGLDIFVFSFGIAFVLANTRVQRGIKWVRPRHIHRSSQNR